MGGVAPQFVVAVGDNFYNDGIDLSTSTSTNPSKRFKHTFEDVYTAASLQVPWHVIAGNHDHKGSVAAQIDYSNSSARWRFPDYYYTFTKSFTSDAGTPIDVQFVMIDTVLLSGLSADDDVDVPFVKPDAVVAAKQWQWIQATLNASTADWLIVCGHYPVWSVGNHGPTPDLVQSLDPLLKKYGVSLYLSGHEHNVEFLRGSLDYIVTGAGHELEYSKKTLGMLPSNVQLRYYYPPSANFQSGDGMFTFMQVFDEYTLNTTYIDINGNARATIATANRRMHGKKRSE
jgi:tartrate-resistant acid phosphatase type 5